MTRTLKDYRPQHDDECYWHLCAGCSSTFRACRVAGACHDVRRACTCGLDALLAECAPAPVVETPKTLQPYGEGTRACVNHDGFSGFTEDCPTCRSGRQPAAPVTPEPPPRIGLTPAPPER